MKHVLALAAAFGLSVSAAMACPMKNNVSASADSELVVAGIVSEPMSTRIDAPTPDQDDVAD